jgi:membrane protein required for colicin V production
VAPLDIIVVAVLCLSALAGLWRGFLYEALMLLGWGIAFLVAQAFASQVGGWLPLGGLDAMWRQTTGFLLVFVVALFVVGILASLIRRLASAVGARPVDRALGLLFGLARGVLVVLIAGVVVHMLTLEDRPWWRGAFSATTIDAALQMIRPELPPRWAGFLR